MRRLARWMSVVSLIGVFAVYVAAKIDFYRHFDPRDTTGYLAGHWPFWMVMVGLAGLAYALGDMSSDSERTENKDA